MFLSRMRGGPSTVRVFDASGEEPSSFPHFEQKRASGAFAALQSGHFTTEIPLEKTLIDYDCGRLLSNADNPHKSYSNLTVIDSPVPAPDVIPDKVSQRSRAGSPMRTVNVPGL